MLRAFRSRCKLLGLLWALLFCAVSGVIEIVEEQRCHDHHFRLICRDLDSHIAVLEAWYTSLEDYHRLSNVTKPESLRIRTENDSELNRVYIYSSPKHNGIYSEVNSSVDNIGNRENVSDSLTFENLNVTFLNDSYFFNGSAEMLVEQSEECGVASFSRSYASWREGDKRRRPMERSSSINLRAPVNYRCIGVNHCSFILVKDYPPAATWAPGAVFIKYACFDDTVSLHYCNREVRISPTGGDSEGYIRTPGYPNFYVGQECSWRLVADPQQRIRVTLLDVSLRSIGPFENHCTDSITITDADGSVLMTSCEQVDLPLRVKSVTNQVKVKVDAMSTGAYPKRGVLLHYKSIGCVTPKAPSNGYLVYRNDDVAHYMCNVKYVFIDTRQRARLVWCFDDNRWNDTVPFCVEETAGAAVGNDSVNGTDKDPKLPPNDPNMIVDIVIPSLLIAALFIGNAFIVLIIYKYRKRKNEDLDDEYNTIPLSVNGNVQSVGNAV